MIDQINIFKSQDIIMGTQFTSKDKNKILKSIRKKYKKVSKTPDGLFKYPTGRAGLEALQYDNELIRNLPEFCGVGNPFSLGPINEGEKVLDIGCGAGIDTMVAVMMTGPSGKAVGIDAISEMLEKARVNLSMTELKNISFHEASAENLPFPNREFDVVISNGVLNLVPNKPKALAEVLRVLKPEGRLMIADQILIGELPKEKKQILKSWSQ
jgi:SAM-dependent methyltransferase